MRVHPLLPAALLALALASCGDGDNGGPAPGDLRLSSMSATAIGLKWDDTSGNTLDHRIYRDDLGDGLGYEEVGVQNKLLTSYTDSTVQAGHTYRYYVVYYDASGEYRWSNVIECVAADPYVTVTAPTSGETLLLANQYEIQWDTNVPGFDANILLHVEGTWHEILFYSPPQPGRWTWTVGNDAAGSPLTFSMPATDCKIQVRHYDEHAWSGDSGTFTISSP